MPLFHHYRTASSCKAKRGKSWVASSSSALQLGIGFGLSHDSLPSISILCFLPPSSSPRNPQVFSQVVVTISSVVVHDSSVFFHHSSHDQAKPNLIKFTISSISLFFLILHPSLPLTLTLSAQTFAEHSHQQPTLSTHLNHSSQLEWWRSCRA